LFLTAMPAKRLLQTGFYALDLVLTHLLTRRPIAEVVPRRMGPDAEPTTLGLKLDDVDDRFPLGTSAVCVPSA